MLATLYKLWWVGRHLHGMKWGPLKYKGVVLMRTYMVVVYL